MGGLIGKRRQVVTTQVVITKTNNASGQASQPRTTGGGHGGNGGGNGGGGGYGGNGGGGGQNSNRTNRDDIHITGAVGGNVNSGSDPGNPDDRLPENFNYAAEKQRPNALKDMNLADLASPGGGVERYKVC